MKKLSKIKRWILINIISIGACYGQTINFEFSDNSDNESGFEVWTLDAEGEKLSLIETLEADQSAFSLQWEAIENSNIAVRAFAESVVNGETKHFYSGFSNSVPIPSYVNLPSNLTITININVQSQ